MKKKTSYNKVTVEVTHCVLKTVKGKHVIDEIAVHNPNMMLLFKTLPINSERPL